MRRGEFKQRDTAARWYTSSRMVVQFLTAAMLLTIGYSSSAMPAISRHRFIVFPSSDAAPALGRLVFPACLGAPAPSNSHGSASFSL